MIRKTLAGVTALLLALGMTALTASPASADQPEFICDDYSPGTDKTDTTDPKPSSITHTAPDGFLIDQYCVKASTVMDVIDVVPPQKTVTFSHSQKDTISHWEVRYVPDPCWQESEVDTLTVSECDPPDDLCPNLDEVQETVPEGYVLVEGECVPPPPDCEEQGEARVAAAVVEEGCPLDVTEVTGTPTHQTCVAAKDDAVGTLVTGSIQLSISDPLGVTGISYAKNGGSSANVDLGGSLKITGLGPGTYDFVVTVAEGYEPVPGFSVVVKTSKDPACAKVEICHANEGQGGDGYVEIDVSAKSIFNVPNGHDLHEGDIIPPFQYNDGDAVLEYPGKNWEPDIEGCLQLTTEGPVTPELTSKPATCEADGSYTLVSPAALEGKSSTTVRWYVDGVLTAPGTYRAAAGTSLVVKVVANGPDYVLDDFTTERTYPALVFAEPEQDCDLTTLALTGQEDPSSALALAGFLGLLGVAMVRTARRTARFRAEV